MKFHSEWGKVRLYNMIRDRGDWVISRQRAWGVPLPIFYAEDGTAIMTAETIEHVAQLFEEHGSSIWWERDAKDLLPEGFTHPGSPNGEFKKETDIMDVWFDSGSSWNGVVVNRPELTYPADLYLEGSDQYRGWFNSSLNHICCQPWRSTLQTNSVHKVLLLMVKVRRCLNLLEIPLLQAMLKNNSVLKSCVFG